MQLSDFAIENSIVCRERKGISLLYFSMASKTTLARETSHGGDKRIQTQRGGSGSLWSNQDEMRRYVSKLKSELDEQKSRVKRVHRDKAEEIKRLHENLDSEKQKAIENVSKKLESDKAYELKKMKESVVRQKEFELRQVLRVKDEEMRALRQELQESKNTTRVLELENKRIASEQSRGEQNEQDRRWRNEVSSLRNDKKRLEETLKIKSEADFEKAELIRKMKQEHDAEIRRLTRESKRESLKEFRQFKAVSREVELKNHQLAAKEAEMQRLEREKNHLGYGLNSQRRGSIKKSNSFNSQKVKVLCTSQNSESDFDNVAEEKIKKLKMRNSELVAIARKLEEKAKQLQEEKDLLVKSNEVNSPDVGNLKKAFARQRARDLAERAKLLMNKDYEINNLKREVQETRHNGFAENGSADELEKIVHQTSKERLLLEKQVSLKVESLLEEIKDTNARNTRLRSDNDILKEQVSKLEDFESKYYATLSETKETRKRNAILENACSDKDKRLYKLDLEKQAYTAKNNALQKKNNELLCKVDQLNKVEKECAVLKENMQGLTNENHLMREENAKLRKQVESLFGVKKDVERLQQENINLEEERESATLKLKERDDEIISLRKAQELAQRTYSEEVSGLRDMVRRLNEQQAESTQRKAAEMQDGTSASYVFTSTPKDSKCTQTSRPSSPDFSPITHNGLQSLQRNEQQDEEDNSCDGEDFGRGLLTVPYNGTSSSTSFDLEKAGTRIQHLAASDSDEVDSNGKDRQEQQSSVSSEISKYSEDESGVSDEDTSYSADVSRTSDVEGQGDKTLQHDEEESDDEDSGNDRDMYIGSPLQDLPDLEEKLSIFIAKYNYDPMLYSPNENPETELAFQAGDYLYVYGEMDEDGFYVGELMSGERGLVPSNFVERIAEDEAILKDSDGIERRHEMFRSSLDHVLTDQLDDIRESDEDDLGTSPHSENELGNRKNRINNNNKPEADQGSSEGVNSTDSDVPAPRAPSPTKLSLDRQFTNSALISWRGATLPSEEIQGYNIYVDGKFKTQVKGSKKTNAVVEDIKPTETYRLSVRTKSINGVESCDHEATMVFGPDAKLSPSDLRITKITATSGEIQWLPAHSSYEHEIFLNEILLDCVKPGCVSYAINDLSPSTSYQVVVRTQIPEHVKVTVGRVDQDSLSAEVDFTTAEGGLPEPPVDLRLAQRTSEYIVLTWLPVTLSLNGYSNGYKVSSYKVYVNGLYCMETDSACADSVNISFERLKNLGRRHDFSRMLFVVRTLSVLGESVDSNVVEIMSNSVGLNDVGVLVEGNMYPGNDNAIPKCIETAGVDNTEGDSTESERNSSNLSGKEVRPYPILEHADRNEDTLLNGLTDKSDHYDKVEQLTLDKGLDDTGKPSEGNRKPTGTDDAEIDSVGDDKIDNVAELKIRLVGDLSRAGDDPTTVVRRQPVVTRYDDGVTESESCSTETKTEDTDEELIERFIHLEISEKNEASTSKVDENEKARPIEDATVSPGTYPESLDAKTTSGAEYSSEKLNSEQHDSEPFGSEQLELDNNTPKHLNEEKSKHGDPSDVSNLELLTETKTITDEEYKTDSTPEKGTSRSPSSLTTKHQSESETDSEIKDEMNHAKQFHVLVQNAVSKDADNGMQARVPNVGPLHSESETETEYGPPLSVIDEVDEENLTNTNNPSSQKTTADATSDSEATLSNSRLNSLPIDSSKSSDLSGRRSQTIASDDEGFRTEDDVLDLLDDDDGLIGKITGECKGDEGVFRVNKDKCANDRTTVEVSVENKVNEINSDNVGARKDNDRVLEDTSAQQAKNNGDTDGYKSNGDSQSQEETVSCSVQENVKSNPSSCTTEDELTEDLSDLSCPTRTLKSHSSSSISEAPPSAHHALDTIINTLSLPSNRGTASGESDHNGNVLTSSERTSEVISEGEQSGSELNENIPEQVRYFIALYSYDPSVMSPNVDGADEELPFKEGDIIKIFGDKDDDGFYWGESKLTQGFVPSNMISEMNINEAEDLFNEASNDVRLHNELNDNSRGQMNGELDVDVISHNFIPGDEGTGASDRLSFWDNLENDAAFGPRRMKALYDYDPVRDSPNVDSEVELKFKAEQIIYVFGEMDDDGFYKGELNGIRGLVPSNFLQSVDDINFDGILVNKDSKQTSDSNTNATLFAQDRQSNESLTNNVEQGRTEEAEVPHKKKKNIFSKGRKMFKKAFKQER